MSHAAPPETDALDAARRDLGLTPIPRGLRSWVLPALITALAGVLRLWDLGRIRTLIFDETYYVKEAYALLREGVAMRWPDDPNPAFEAGHVDTYLHQGDFVVHPPVGKWVIAVGEWALGADNPWGWRISVALLGTFAVWMIARTAGRMFGSTTLAAIAALLLAVDGMAITESRVSILDSILAFFVLAAFAALVIDRQMFRGRLAALVVSGDGSAPPPKTAAAIRLTDAEVATARAFGGAYRTAHRPWRLVAGVMLGLACGTKWSGIYVLALFGIMTVLWDMTARRAAGQPSWLRAGILRDGFPAFGAMVGTSLAVYVASWAGWFASDKGADRLWAQQNPGQGVTFLPPVLRSFVQYHVQAYEFHIGLDSPHTYQANPFGWILQLRPTSFYYRTYAYGDEGCQVEKCSAAVTNLGNPLIWWLGAAALIVMIVLLIWKRDWRAGAILAGVVSGWCPWFQYLDRTIFTFYAVEFLPFVVLGLTYALGLLLGPRRADADHRFAGAAMVGAILATIVLVSAFYYPVWTGQVIPYPLWRAHMWLASWI